MDKEYFGVIHLLNSEDKTAFDTNHTLKGVAANYSDIINVLFKLPYFKGELEIVDTPIGDFQSFCYDSYIQAPHTFWVIYDLYQKGYYIEATTLYRQLLEVFVQLKYFHKYPEKTNEHLMGKYKTFKTMFTEFTSADFYDRQYGKTLSSFAHGKLANYILRYEKDSDKNKWTVVMGCKFNIDHATYVINQVIPLLFGYLNLFTTFFPKNILDEDKLIYQEYLKVLDWLKLYMKSHQEQNPDSIKYYEEINKLIY